MYCECSNKNNFEVISLCDIKKFQDKNGPFNNKPWTQISIADILMLDRTKFSIEKVEKIYVKTSITHTKVIQTPRSISPNAEGMSLTGKKLLVDGFICSKIVYTSLTREQSVYTSNFILPFCTYIVIDGNADEFNDTYCVKTCIEDAFISLIDCKTIFLNVTLFLLAEKNSILCPNPQLPKEDCTVDILNPPNPGPQPPPINFLPNIIKLNAVDNTPVVNIKFDSTNSKIIVDSTGKTTDGSGGTEYFKFTLYDFDGKTEKITDKIGGNMSGANFSNKISNTNFQNNDIITLAYEASNKVIITNFPTATTPFYNPKGSTESFRITPRGLVPHRPLPPPPPPNPGHLPNAFILYSFDTNEEVVRVEFNITDSRQTLTTKSTGKLYNKGGNFQVFQFFAMNGNTNDVFDSGSVLGNENGDKFVADLNTTIANFNEAVMVGYLDRTQVVLTNYPNMGDNYVMLDKNSQSFLITQNGIIENLLPNIITLKDVSNNPIITIKFDFLAKKILCQPTNNVVNANFIGQDYFVVTLFDNNGTKVRENGKIQGGQNGTPLSTAFFGQAYSFGNILQLDYLENTKVEITNFPNTGDPVYNPTGNSKKFRITDKGLVGI